MYSPVLLARGSRAWRRRRVYRLQVCFPIDSGIFGSCDREALKISCLGRITLSETLRMPQPLNRFRELPPANTLYQTHLDPVRSTKKAKDENLARSFVKRDNTQKRLMFHDTSFNRTQVASIEASKRLYRHQTGHQSSTRSSRSST